MKQSQFFGWVKKAYPDVKYNKRSGGDIWFSNFRLVQVIAKFDSDNTFEFYQPGNESPIICHEDTEIIKNTRLIWGDPGVAFSYSEPKKSQPRTTATTIKDLLEELKSDAEIIKVPGGEAVKINGSKLVLYDLGISSKPSEFIPWAREEEVKECIENFIKQNNYE